jgi:hypothetical protein
MVPREETPAMQIVGQKVSEDDDKGSSNRHQGVLELFSCSEVSDINKVGRKMVSVISQPRRTC